MKKIAILQSNYIPWKGYFDMINMVDDFVIYDEVQFTKNDWRNRNIIKTFSGTQWLTIPVKITGHFGQKINETEIVSERWVDKHLKTLQYNYKRAQCFEEMFPKVEKLYDQCRGEKLLSNINYVFLKGICDILGIKTNLIWASDLEYGEGKVERLIRICQLLEGGEYISGKAAKSYIDETMFEDAGIQLTWMDYSGYPSYQQLHGEFVHEVSILDMLFHLGDAATDYMKSF